MFNIHSYPTVTMVTTNNIQEIGDVVKLFFMKWTMNLTTAHIKL